MPLTDRDADFYKVTLKSWLYERIKWNKQNSYTLYPGLEWLDEERRCFKLPWVTESHPDWEKYYKLFHEWASREGKQSTDSQKAKRNFRSALNHSKHFEHIAFMDKERQIESFKVYRFLTQEEIMKAKPRNTSEDSSVSQMTPEPHVATSNHGVMEVSPNADQAAMPEGEGGYYNNLNIDPNNLQQQQWSQHAGQMNITDDIVEGDIEIPSMDFEKQSSTIFDDVMRDNESKCAITVEYNGRKVDYREVMLNEGSCWILYGNEDHAATVQFLNGLRKQPLPLSPKEIITLMDPPIEAPGLTRILENMNTGIHIWYEKGEKSFYLLRECLAHVYCFNMHEDAAKHGKPQQALQLERKRPYLMLSYNQLVSESLEPNFQDESATPKPSDTVEIIVGIQPKPEDYQHSVKGVKISVQFLGATDLLNNEDLLQEIKISSKISSLDQNLMDFRERQRLMQSGVHLFQA